MATARLANPDQSLRTNGRAGHIPRPNGLVAATECSSRGPEQASQPLYGTSFGNSFLHCSEMIGYSHFFAENALIIPMSQRMKPASSKTQASRNESALITGIWKKTTPKMES